MDDDALLCPISLEPMRDPVSAPDGRVYDRANIERWLREHGTSPLTREEMDADQLHPVIMIRELVRAKYPDLPAAEPRARDVAKLVVRPRPGLPTAIIEGRPRTVDTIRPRGQSAVGTVRERDALTLIAVDPVAGSTRGSGERSTIATLYHSHDRARRSDAWVDGRGNVTFVPIDDRSPRAQIYGSAHTRQPTRIRNPPPEDVQRGLRFAAAMSVEMRDAGERAALRDMRDTSRPLVVRVSNSHLYVIVVDAVEDERTSFPDPDTIVYHVHKRRTVSVRVENGFVRMVGKHEAEAFITAVDSPVHVHESMSRKLDVLATEGGVYVKGFRGGRFSVFAKECVVEVRDSTCEGSSIKSTGWGVVRLPADVDVQRMELEVESGRIERW